MAVKHLSIPPLSPQDLNRFWSRVDIRGPDECWNWMVLERSVDCPHCGHSFSPKRKYFNQGYVRIAGQRLLSSRVAWTIAHGPIPANLFVCHRCDNPVCCNPRHLFLGTNLDNVRDRDRKGRQITPCGEQNGFAKLTARQVHTIRAECASGQANQKTLANRYGVSKATICHVVTRRSWTHLV